MKNSHLFEWIVAILLVVGGLNWGLIGLFKFDLISSLFGHMSTFSRVLYSLVGLAAVARIACWVKCNAK